MRADLTILIPTHERRGFLARSMAWYDRAGLSRVVMDSSARSSADLVAENPLVRYWHEPGMDYCRKMQRALERIETPFTVLSPDDDFLFLPALDACVAFLDGHADHATAQGRFLSFVVGTEAVWARPLYRHRKDWQVDEPSPLERLRRLMGNYMHLVYAVHRTATLRRIFDDLAGPLENGDLMEFFLGLSALLDGRHRTLPVLYAARQDVPGSWGRQSGLKHANLEQMHRQGAAAATYRHVAARLAARLAEAGGASDVTAPDAVRSLFDLYLDRLPELESEMHRSDGIRLFTLAPQEDASLPWTEDERAQVRDIVDLVRRFPDCGQEAGVLQSFADLDPDRPVYVYGGGAVGCRLARHLRNTGVAVRGFLDSREGGMLDGLPRLTVRDYASRHVPENQLLLASQHHAEMRDSLESLGITGALNALSLSLTLAEE